MMDDQTRAAVETVIEELQSDIALARTRDESVRLTRRVLKLQRIVIGERV